LLPNADFSDRAPWREIDDNRFAATRARLLIVHSNGKQSRLGSAIAEYNIAPNDSIEISRRRERVISRTETITEALRFTTTAKIIDKLSVKLGSELAGQLPGFSGKLQSEVLSSSDYEISEAMENTLSNTTSYLFQEVDETKHVITLKGGTEGRVATLRRRFWPRQWDIYLHSYEYLELTYRRSWLWWQVRESIKQTDSGVLGRPLLSLIYFEPQPDVDVAYSAVADELEEGDAFRVQPVTKAMPRVTVPKVESLEGLAKLAFPVSKQERAASDARRVSKKAAAKKAGKKKAAKKAAAKKAAAKKAAPKKAAPKKKSTKAMTKKTVKMKAPRKSAGKKKR
jgi:hypothetical protein